MKSDFSRDTFDPAKMFTRVLSQQGRVQLDADWNEQVSILLEFMRTLANDLIGEHGGTATAFKIEGLADHNFTIGAGRYYVQGLPCDNFEKVEFSALKPWQKLGAEISSGKEYWVYLDVWERHVTYVEDDDIREKALNGPDTAARGQLVWQIKTVSRIAAQNGQLNSQNQPNQPNDPDELVAEEFLAWIKRKSDAAGMLSARSGNGPNTNTSPCEIRADSGYRGVENQLYRVEIHSAPDPTNTDIETTWKWSRDNGSVIFPVRSITVGDDSTTVNVEHLGRDERFGLKPGNLVEIVDDDYVLLGQAHRLLEVKDVRPNDLQIVLRNAPATNDVGTNADRHPLLRRWDQTRPTADVAKSDKSNNGAADTWREDDGVFNLEPGIWVELENGIEIRFSPEKRTYRAGDYWLIPARVATGSIEWPMGGDGSPIPQPPRGINHYYAPLARLGVDNQGAVTLKEDLRRKISSVSSIMAP